MHATHLIQFIAYSIQKCIIFLGPFFWLEDGIHGISVGPILMLGLIDSTRRLMGRCVDLWVEIISRVYCD